LQFSFSTQSPHTCGEVSSVNVLMSVNRSSYEYVPIAVDDDHSEEEEGVIPRVRLSREISESSRINDIIITLTAMGFTDEQSSVAAFYGRRSVSDAVEFLTADKNPRNHRFIPDGEGSQLCAVCLLQLEAHSAHLETNSPQPRRESEIKFDMEQVKANLPRISGTGALCQICYCEYDEKEMEFLECSHFFCKECISQWIRVQVSDGKVSEKQIFCPNVECKKPLSSEVIEARAEPEILEKYKKFTLSNKVERDKNATWCQAAGCDGIVYRPNQAARKGVCEKCGYELCFKCNQPYHGFWTSCTKDVDEKFEQYAKEQFMKRCPSCSKYIFKVDGCNHMTCSCGYEFVRLFISLGLKIDVCCSAGFVEGYTTVVIMLRSIFLAVPRCNLLELMESAPTTVYFASYSNSFKFYST
jgi:E3 ubiquitin-protein ligase RNF144